MQSFLIEKVFIWLNFFRFLKNYWGGLAPPPKCPPLHLGGKECTFNIKLVFICTLPCRARIEVKNQFANFQGNVRIYQSSQVETQTKWHYYLAYCNNFFICTSANIFFLHIVCSYKLQYETYLDINSLLDFFNLSNKWNTIIENNILICKRWKFQFTKARIELTNYE